MMMLILEQNVQNKVTIDTEMIIKKHKNKFILYIHVCTKTCDLGRRVNKRKQIPMLMLVIRPISSRLLKLLLSYYLTFDNRMKSCICAIKLIKEGRLLFQEACHRSRRMFHPSHYFVAFHI